MKRLPFFVVIVSIALFANKGEAQGKVNFDKNFPKFEAINAFSSKIVAKGHVTLDAGWSVVGNKVKATVWLPDGGQVVKVVMIPVAANKWGPHDIGPLATLTTYHIIVEADLTDGTNTVRVITNPHTKKTP